MSELAAFEEYWETYRTLQWIFMEKKKAAIVDYMEESKQFVNGLSDGWFEFSYRLANMKKMWPSQFEGESGEMLEALTRTLDQWLKRR